MKKAYLLRESGKARRVSNALFVQLRKLAKLVDPKIKELDENKKLADWVDYLLPFELGYMRVRRAEDAKGPFLIYEIEEGE